MTELASWNDTATREAIESYVANATGDRVAVFDNDGTLWCEKPVPIQLDFIIRRWAAMAEHDTALRAKQPFKAAHERDHAWLSAAMTKHYEGDDRDLKLIMAGVAEAFDGMAVDAYAADVAASSPRRSTPPSGGPTSNAPFSRWSSCCGTWRRTGSARSSPPAATATSCARSRRRCTASHPSV